MLTGVSSARRWSEDSATGEAEGGYVELGEKPVEPRRSPDACTCGRRHRDIHDILIDTYRPAERAGQ